MTIQANWYRDNDVFLTFFFFFCLFAELGVAGEKTHDAQGHSKPRAQIPQAETGAVDHHG